MRKLVRIKLCLLGLIGAALILCACAKPVEQRLSGQTMGTTYSVVYVPQKGLPSDKIADVVARELAAINQSMSVFDPHSEISRFNALSAAETQAAPFVASAAFYEVMLQSQQLYVLSQGAWDATVMPLVNLWGFGPRGQQYQPPAEADVALALTQTGFDKINLGPHQTLVKNAEVTVDLASIAKGYGVDCVARALEDIGLQSFLVEIGGEVYARGLKLNQTPWRVGINVPSAANAFNEIYAVVELNNRALATSGNYRNYFEAEGLIYAHILDPRTGYPVISNIASVSVIAPTCAQADGLATTMTVLGLEKSLALAAADSEVEVFIITEISEGVFESHLSPGMQRYLVD